MEISRDNQRKHDTNSYKALYMSLHRVAMNLNLRYYEVVSTLNTRVLTNVRE
jgi:hypothetical protein